MGVEVDCQMNTFEFVSHIRVNKSSRVGITFPLYSLHKYIVIFRFPIKAFPNLNAMLHETAGIESNGIERNTHLNFAHM